MAPESPPLPAVASGHRLVVLYASQTGNAMDVADRVEREAKRGCFPDVAVVSMDSFDPSLLADERFVVFVVSTMGQGDPPDSMKGFWRYLLQRRLGAQWLQGLHYAVFGLGDSKYQNYNFPAKKLDLRLFDLGAKRIIEKGLGNDHHPSGLKSSITRLHKMSTFQGTNQRLTTEDSERDVRHFELEDPCSAISYQIGDCLEILPSQKPSDVDAFINRCKLDPDCYITIRAKGGVKVPKCSHVNSSMDRIKLKTFVALTMDVASASPRRYFFEVMSYFATDKKEKETLKNFAPKGRDDRTVLEVLKYFPSVQMPFEWLVQLTPPLKKRTFSISSSPLAHPNQIHLTVSIVSWINTSKKKRHGLCSTWLAGLSPNKGGFTPSTTRALSTINTQYTLISCLTCRESYTMLDTSRIPAISTSINSSRAYWTRNRMCAISWICRGKVCTGRGKTNCPCSILLWLEDSDYLYKDFWLSHNQTDRVLSTDNGGGFFVAFSRDQPQKIYVQDKIKENGARVVDMLCSKEVAIYVVGSSTKMPADVTAALEEVICKESSVSRNNASGWLNCSRT